MEWRVDTSALLHGGRAAIEIGCRRIEFGSVGDAMFLCRAHEEDEDVAADMRALREEISELERELSSAQDELLAVEESLGAAESRVEQLEALLEEAGLEAPCD